MNYLQVQNMAHLYALQNHDPGEVAFVIDENKMMMWDEAKGWVEMSDEAKAKEFNTGITLYDVNKNLVNNLEPLSKEMIQQKDELLKMYFKNTKNNHHMLLCSDYKYYTIFTHSMLVVKDFASTILEVVEELGTIYSIDITTDGAIEFWIKPFGESSPFAFYLFPYDAGVVYYG